MLPWGVKVIRPSDPDLIRQLKNDEGVRAHLYKDSVGVWTIGVGRNLQSTGLRQSEINYLLTNDIQTAMQDCQAVCSNFESLTENRQRALANMAFNLGRTRLGKFRKALAAIEAEDWSGAASEMLNSRWAKQVGSRAVRLAEMMERG